MVISHRPEKSTWHQDAVMAPHPVVVGIEGKQPSALRFAAEAALTRGVELRVVHCLDGSEGSAPLDDPMESALDWSPGPGQDLLDGAKIVIDGLTTAPPTHYMHGAGSPYETLLTEAFQASLVVVGTDSIGRLERLFDGTVTEHLVKTAPVPVVIVPESPQPDRPGSGVVLVMDAHSLATGPIHFAFEEASRRGADLCVVHLPPTGRSPAETATLHAELARSLAGWPQQYPDVTVTCRLTQGAADERCLHESEEAGLLVLGRGSGRAGHAVLAQLARRANCPCIVVPDTWSDS